MHGLTSTSCGGENNGGSNSISTHVQELYDGVGVGGTNFGTYSFFIFKSSTCTPKETTRGVGGLINQKYIWHQL